MKYTTVNYYCDICESKMDYPRFIKMRKKFIVNSWGVVYDVCEDCYESIAAHIIKLKKGETDGKT